MNTETDVSIFYIIVGKEKDPHLIGIEKDSQVTFLKGESPLNNLFAVKEKLKKQGVEIINFNPEKQILITCYRKKQKNDIIIAHLLSANDVKIEEDKIVKIPFNKINDFDFLNPTTKILAYLSILTHTIEFRQLQIFNGSLSISINPF